VHELTSASATASYVHANPADYGTTEEGMPSETTLKLQLGQLINLVYAQTFHLSGHLAQLNRDITAEKLTNPHATAEHVHANP
jgi:hypothetical protein